MAHRTLSLTGDSVVDLALRAAPEAGFLGADEIMCVGAAVEGCLGRAEESLSRETAAGVLLVVAEAEFLVAGLVVAVNGGLEAVFGPADRVAVDGPGSLDLLDWDVGRVGLRGGQGGGGEEDSGCKGNGEGEGLHIE